eukprot:gene13091-13218_t
MSSRKAPRLVLARSNGPTLKDVKEVEQKVEAAIQEAEETCKENDAKHCAAAWDNVEELAAEVSHKKAKLKDNPSATDPLEQFCDENPEADECRVYVS